MPVPPEEVLRKGLSLGQVSDESLVGQFSHSPPGWVQFTQSQHKDRTQSKGVRFSKPKMTTSNPDKLCLATRDRPSQIAFAALTSHHQWPKRTPGRPKNTSRPKDIAFSALGPKTLSSRPKDVVCPRALSSWPQGIAFRPKGTVFSAQELLFSTQGHSELCHRRIIVVSLF